jgi:uncharacterized membrane protein required for colicin V production
MIIAILILIFLLVIAACWWFGLWSNLITLVNLILAGMVASSLYPVLAGKIMAWQPTYRMLAEFVSLWTVFVLAFILLRGITDVLSPIRLKFDFLTETIGRSVLSVCIASVFVCFTMFSLQLAPLPPDWFGSSKQANTAIPDAPADFKTKSAFGPDRLWISFIRSASKGAFAESREKSFLLPTDRREFVVNEKPLELESRVFDPLGLFFVDRESYRTAVSRSKTLRVR